MDKLFADGRSYEIFLSPAGAVNGKVTLKEEAWVF